MHRLRKSNLNGESSRITPKFSVKPISSVNPNGFNNFPPRIYPSLRTVYKRAETSERIIEFYPSIAVSYTNENNKWRTKFFYILHSYSDAFERAFDFWSETTGEDKDHWLEYKNKRPTQNQVATLIEMADKIRPITKPEAREIISRFKKK